MIGLCEKATDVATVENFRERLRHLVATHFAGSAHKFAREVKVGRQLSANGRAVSLTSLLELTYRLGTTPVDFLMEYTSPETALTTDEGARGGRRRFSRQRLTYLKGKLDQLAIDLHERDEPLPLEAIARRLGVSAVSLRAHFPDAVDALRRHNTKTRAGAAAKRDEAKAAAIRDAMQALVERGEPTSKKYITRALRQFGVGWETPEIIATSRAELARLCAKA
jgi:hypothetical protein